MANVIRIPIVVPKTSCALFISKSSTTNMYGIEIFQLPKYKTVTNNEEINYWEKKYKINIIIIMYILIVSRHVIL